MSERPTMDELQAKLPDAAIERVRSGELVIYTGLTDLGVADGEPLEWFEDIEPLSCKADHDDLNCQLADLPRADWCEGCTADARMKRTD